MIPATLTKTETLEFTMFCMAKLKAHTFAELEPGLVIIVNSAYEEYIYLHNSKEGKQYHKEAKDGEITPETEAAFKKRIYSYQKLRNKQAQELLDRLGKK